MNTVIISILLFISSLFFVKRPIQSASYSPPTSPELKANDHLTTGSRFFEGLIKGGEDVAHDIHGNLYVGTEDGKIWKFFQNKKTLFANTQGRPLGLHFDNKGNLIVADAVKGLLSISPQGQISLLVNSANGIPFKFTDDLDIAQDGKIYFTDASWKFNHHQYLFDLLEAKPYGRLLVYDPQTKKVTVLLDKLFFANGVALSQGDTFVLVNETYRYRIKRYWLKGIKKGKSDYFAQNLPGFPDGISSNEQGIFWLAMFTVRNPFMDFIHPYPFIKNFLSILPKFLWPKPKPYGLVFGLDEEGRIKYNLQDSRGKIIYQVTSIEEYKKKLYLGNLNGNFIGVYPLEKSL